MWVIYSDFFQLFSSGMVSLVVVMLLGRLFDTIIMYLFKLILKPLRSLKIFISGYVYVVNLDLAVITLLFGASIDIHDAVRYI